MDIQIAKKWVNKRLASEDYAIFRLADLFYKGKIPLCPIDDFKQAIQSMGDTEDCELLLYNPLKREVKKKTNYLLSRPYTVSGKEQVSEYLSDCVRLLKSTVEELYKKGEVWWEFEPDMTSPLRFKITPRPAQSIVPHYTDEEENKYDSVGYLWNEVNDQGAVIRYVDFVDADGRHRYNLTSSGVVEQNSGHANRQGEPVIFNTLPFVRLRTDGLYQQIVFMGTMYSHKYKQADDLLEDTTSPVAVVKNASETDSEILSQDIKENKLVKVEGTGDFSYASRQGDYSSVESFMKMLKSDISDVCGTVSREQELNYVTSGRALDRLYIDMDNDAADMSGLLRDALKQFLGFVSAQVNSDFVSDFDIIFNTDKPTDESQIIQNIGSSSTLLSTRTLLEQHPWVEDVDEELARKEEEKKSVPEPTENPLTPPTEESLEGTDAPPKEQEQEEQNE